MKHNHSPIMQVLAKIAWLITAIVSILVGLVPLGFNVLKTGIFAGALQLYAAPLYYLVGAAGLISLLAFFKFCTYDWDCKC